MTANRFAVEKGVPHRRSTPAPRMMAALPECDSAFTQRIDWETVRREIGAALRGNPSFAALVSPLYVFDRPQDLSFQRSR